MTPCYWAIVETNLNEETNVKRVFKIDVANMPYRHSISMSGFFWPGKYRNYKPSYKVKNFLYVHQPYDEWKMLSEMTNQSFAKYGIEAEEYTIIHVKDIHEFFKIIGYDYKKQKYL